MKTTTMICENCARQFYSEYYDGGYIDHMNMVNNFDVSIKRGIEDIVTDICMKGNEYRDLYDIENRQDCFIKYLQKQQYPNINELITILNEKKEYIANLLKIRQEIQNKLYELNYEDRLTIINNLFA